jgi:hypothetical protein
MNTDPERRTSSYDEKTAIHSADEDCRSGYPRQISV